MSKRAREDDGELLDGELDYAVTFCAAQLRSGREGFGARRRATAGGSLLPLDDPHPIRDSPHRCGTDLAGLDEEDVDVEFGPQVRTSEPRAVSHPSRAIHPPPSSLRSRSQRSGHPEIVRRRPHQIFPLLAPPPNPPRPFFCSSTARPTHRTRASTRRSSANARARRACGTRRSFVSRTSRRRTIG